MEKCIKYYDDNNNLIILDYSDNKLKEIIEKHINRVTKCDQINMIYEECEHNKGQVGVYFSNTKNDSVNKEYAAFILHSIDLTNDTYNANTKECQREKNYIKRHFPHIKVISNFR